MTQTSTLPELKRFALECLRLLYWVYFKPYTLRRHLRAIHPDLDEDSNPFAMRAEWDAYPGLRHYAEQVWWTTVLAPWAALLLVAPLYTWFAGEPFVFGISMQFLLGWLMGNWIARIDPKRFAGWMTRLLWIVSVLTVLTAAMYYFFPSFVEVVLGAILTRVIEFGVTFVQMIAPFYPVAFRLAEGLVLGLAGGMGFGLVGGAAISLVMITPICMAFGMAFGRAGEVGLGLTFGLTLGMTLRVWGAGAPAVGAVLAVVLVGGVALAEGAALAEGVVFGTALVISYLLGFLHICFWLPEVLWSVLVRIFTQVRGIQTDYWLPFLPFWYDEVTVFPLPFQNEMIIESYKINPALARQAINHLATSTNQQKVAASAIVGIAIDALKLCRTVEEIQVLSGDLDWIPTPPPRQLDVLLPRFLEVSRAIGAAQKATSTYRRHELLAAPIRALEQMKEGLVFGKNAGLAPLYGGIVERWLGLLQGARRVLAEEAQHTAEIPPVYIAGPALEPDSAGLRFKGRQDLFREIEGLTLAAHPPVLLFYGGRRTGKTSALKYLPRRVGPDLIPLLVDVQGAASATSLAGMAELFAKDAIAAARQSRNLRLPYPDIGGRDPFPALRQWMEQVERTAPGKRFLLCLDEYERLSEIVESTGSRAPLNFLRNIIQHHPRWIVLFSGSHVLDDLPAYWMDYLINTRALRLSYLAESEARELIEQPVPGFPPIYPPEVVDAIVALTRCQPFLVQLTCSELVDRLNREQRKTVTLQDLNAAIPTIFERGEGHFGEFWRLTLNAEERALLGRFVSGEDVTTENSPLLAQLVRKEVLEHTDGAWAFQIPLIRRYVEHRMAMGDG